MDLETTRTEMKKEAIVRMKILKLYDKVIEEFEKENKLNKSEMLHSNTVQRASILSYFIDRFFCSTRLLKLV